MAVNLIGSFADALKIGHGEKIRLEHEEENKRRWEREMAMRESQGQSLMDYREWSQSFQESGREYTQDWNQADRDRLWSAQDSAIETREGAAKGYGDLYAPTMTSEFAGQAPMDVAGNLLEQFAGASQGAGGGIPGLMAGATKAVGGALEGFKQTPTGPHETFGSYGEMMESPGVQGMDPMARQLMLQTAPNLPIETDEMKRDAWLNYLGGENVNTSTALYRGSLGLSYIPGTDKEAHDRGTEQYERQQAQLNKGGVPSVKPDDPIFGSASFTRLREMFPGLTDRQLMDDLFEVDDTRTGQSTMITYDVPGEYRMIKTKNPLGGEGVEEYERDAQGNKIPIQDVRWEPGKKEYKLDSLFINNLRAEILSANPEILVPAASGTEAAAAATTIPDWVSVEDAADTEGWQKFLSAYGDLSEEEQKIKYTELKKKQSDNS